ncbi:hypothetical protein TWF788_001655 [Orbilia oligospora]|uniref:Uncharacterized protein n=1 Tax=Orbilia oligospora TaxID=2813651 RepID=A0A7C8P5N9_ORBOL|nr:hypothetical protein TWF788_001655 [Orbilia oligospora]
MLLKIAFAFAGLLSHAVAERFVPGAYIAEIKGINANGFLNKARTSGIKIRHRMTLDRDTSIFNGVSFKLEDDTPENRAIIESWGEVVELFPLRIYDLAAPAADPAAAEQAVRAVTKILKKRSPDNVYPPHVQGNVHQLHAKGLDGQGIRVAVVDTGIDYRHPSLGGGFGPGFKVEFGTDLVGDSYNGGNTPVPDNDPIDCAGHGTHVAGILAAVDEQYQFTGVAPKVTLGAYKVFGCPSVGTTDEVLISAFCQAVKDKADIISASVSASSGWGEAAWSRAVTRIVEEKGIPCTIAGGNAGGEGLFYAGAAGDATGAISVCSVNNLVTPVIYPTAKFSSSSVQNEPFPFRIMSLKFPAEVFELYVPIGDDGQISDACAGLPADVDITHKIVVIRRGNCNAQVKVDAVTERLPPSTQFPPEFPARIMFISNDPDTFSTGFEGWVYASVTTPATGELWRVLASQGKSISVAFETNPPIQIEILDNPTTGGSLSSGNSWGPTNRLNQRPHICAPGGNILSTTRLTLNQGYSVLSGSSMAAPYIAGVIALYLQKARAEGRTHVPPAEIRIGLATTGRPLVFSNGVENSNFLSPVAQQGGGMIDAYKFLHSRTAVDTDFLEFNDTSDRHFRKAISFKITNIGDAEAFYDLTDISGPTAYTTMKDSTIPQLFPPDMIQSFAAVDIEPVALRIKKGQSKRVTVRVTPPSDLDASRIPVYGGWIKIARNGLDVDSIRIPYMGVAADMKSFKVTNFEQGYPKLLNYRNEGSTETGATEPPVLAWSLVLGSAVVRIDVVSVSDKLANDIRIFSADNIIGSIPGYPLYWNPRSGRGQETQVSWDGQVVKEEGGSPIPVPAGTYQFIYRALRIGGSKSTGRDYDRWVSDKFVWSPAQP